MAVEPAFLSLQPPSGTAQVSGTMDPPKEGTKLLSKFPAPGMNLPETPFHGYFGQGAGFSAIGIISVLPRVRKLLDARRLPNPGSNGGGRTKTLWCLLAKSRILPLGVP